MLETSNDLDSDAQAYLKAFMKNNPLADSKEVKKLWYNRILRRQQILHDENKHKVAQKHPSPR